ncbi:Endonuclease/exonuclease/phosphatase [Mucidula mucida]|nr:Endonuclease/exonuclease/phosphatase [Mucidula mucida]
MIMRPLATSALRLATWNLRFDSQPNSISVSDTLASLPSPLDEPQYLAIANGAEQPWSTRRIRVAEWLKRMNVDAFGIQEGLVRQVTDLQELFGDTWAHVGVGRDDGVTSGEFSAIFYNTQTLELQANDTFWLSETPLEPSRFPGAGSVRLATYTRFHLASGGGRGNVTVLNTHFDDQSNGQRELGASMLLLRARYEAVQSKGPVFVMGDFNSPPRGNSSEGYSIITGALPPVTSINATWAATYAVPADEQPDFVMQDLRGQAPRERVSEAYATYTGFTPPNSASAGPWQRIDFTRAYAVDEVRGDDGVLASDHRPTVVDLDLGV